MSDLSNLQKPQERGIDRLFEKFILSYGQSLVVKSFEGLDVEAVKQNWKNEIKRKGYGFDRLNKACDVILDYHPDFPPRIGQFLKVCEAVAMEIKTFTAIPYNPAPLDPKRWAEVQKEAQSLMTKKGNGSWAIKNLIRARTDKTLSLFAVKSSEEAIKILSLENELAQALRSA